MRFVAILGLSLAIGFSTTSCSNVNTQTVSSPKATESSSLEKAEDVSEAKSGLKTTSPAPTSVSTPLAKRAQVQWMLYPSGSQSEIDRMTEVKDCLGIESFFGMVAATQEKIKSDSGVGSETIIQYLEESLSLAGCP